MKTVLKFDSGSKGFEKAVAFLLILAVLFVLFGIAFLVDFLTSGVEQEI